MLSARAWTRPIERKALFSTSSSGRLPADSLPAGRPHSSSPTATSLRDRPRVPLCRLQRLDRNADGGMACLDNKEGYAYVALECPDGCMRAFEIKVDLAHARSDSPPAYVNRQYGLRCYISATTPITVSKSVSSALTVLYSIFRSIPPTPTARGALSRFLQCSIIQHSNSTALKRTNIRAVTNVAKRIRTDRFRECIIQKGTSLSKSHFQHWTLGRSAVSDVQDNKAVRQV